MSSRSKKGRSRSAGSDRNWWDRWPKRFEQELEAFRAIGVDCKICLKKEGFLVLEAFWPVNDFAGLMDLRVGFSPLHPFFRPVVQAPGAAFDRHQNPLSKHLCLLAQDGVWDHRMMVAEFVDQQLELTLSALDARRKGRWSEAAKIEERTPDPLMPYFAQLSEKDSVVLFDGASPLPDEQHGVLHLTAWPRGHKGEFEAILSQITAIDGRKLGPLFFLNYSAPDGLPIKGRWVKMYPPKTSDPALILSAVDKELARRRILTPKAVDKINATAAGSTLITGIVFPEEGDYHNQNRVIGWVFVVQRREFTPEGATQCGPTLVRGQRAGRGDLFTRSPVAQQLASKKALLVGCGAVGAFVAPELARTGLGSLTLSDRDIVEPGNSVRWPLGRTAWGHEKVEALADHIARDYPWCQPRVYRRHLGLATTDFENFPQDMNSVMLELIKILRDVDVVIDTSASLEVQHALSVLCQETGTPYIMGHATLGAAGGAIACFTPGSESCWTCLQNHWNEGSLPYPPEDHDGEVIPVGCNAATFTGGSFDLQEVSLQAVRTAIYVMTSGPRRGEDWSLAILEHRDEHGQRRLPRWNTCRVPPHADCCGAGREKAT